MRTSDPVADRSAEQWKRLKKQQGAHLRVDIDLSNEGRCRRRLRTFAENLAGLGIHSADRIVPELQDLEGGDTLPLEASSGTGLTVAELITERAIVLHLPEPQTGRSVLSWAYVLESLEGGKTRLILAPSWMPRRAGRGG